MPPRPRARPVGPRLAGPVAAFWAGGAGQIHGMVDSMRRSEGWKPSECAGSKQTKASEVLAGAGEQAAVKIAAALVELLRERRGAGRSRRALHAPASLRCALPLRWRAAS